MLSPAASPSCVPERVFPVFFDLRVDVCKDKISATRKRRTQPYSSREGYEARKMPILQRAFKLAVVFYHRKRKLTPPVIDKCVMILIESCVNLGKFFVELLSSCTKTSVIIKEQTYKQFKEYILQYHTPLCLELMALYSFT